MTGKSDEEMSVVQLSEIDDEKKKKMKKMKKKKKKKKREKRKKVPKEVGRWSLVDGRWWFIFRGPVQP